MQQERRTELKDPLGELWIGDVEVNLDRLKKYLKDKNPKCFASVGDFVSYNLLGADIHPDIVVIDHRIMRKVVPPIEFDRRLVTAPNPQGTITAEAQSALYMAAQGCKHLAIIIDGEEDLLVLPLMVFMPIDSVIVYGQPREGMVVITLTSDLKEWAKNFMSKMQRE